MAETGAPSGRSMPLGSLDAVGVRLTPGGTPILDTFVQQSVDTGLFSKLQIFDAGGTHWVFVAAPSCADIDAAFATCAALDSAVGTCTQLETWGFS